MLSRFAGGPNPKASGVAPAAFDAAAASYDGDFTDTRLGRWLRGRVWRTLAETFQPGQQVLELGCGTGEDAVWLAQRGVSVLATDVSTGMLEVTSAKAQRAGVADQVQLAQFDITDIPRLRAFGRVDGVLANFGVLNCVADRRPLAAALAEQLPPGGRLVAVVMGPVCLWEIAWYALHGDLTHATRRWQAGVEAKLPGGARLRVWYPSPARLRAELAPWFRLRELVGIGTLLPPSSLAALVDKRPSVFQQLARLDDRLPLGAWWADHYLAVFERR